jgi:hypothetical protein
MRHFGHLFNGLEMRAGEPRGVARPPRARGTAVGVTLVPLGPRRVPAGLRVLVAWALHDCARMITPMSRWRRLTPETIADLPESAAVFEVANLVRNVHYIGSAGGNLRARLTAFVQEQARHLPVPGGYYLRYEPAASEDEALVARLAAYRAQHRGNLPVGNREGRPAIRLASRRAA